MTVYSFKKLNPDWEIVFVKPLVVNSESPWYGKQYENKSMCMNYTRHITNELMLRPMIFDFEQIGLRNDMNEVHKSDFIRYYLLYKHGGVWADMDILLTQPMDMLRQNQQKIKSSTYYFWEKGKSIPGHAIGFLLGTPGSQFFHDVFQAAKDNYRPEDYQSVGADLLNPKFNHNVMKRKYREAVSIDKEAVYAINHDDRVFLYEQTNLDMLKKHSIGIHWYGGSEYVKALTLEVNHTNFKTYGNEGTVMNRLKALFGEDF
jgi:hypothetical protein